jgi:hypothetical protein
MMAVLIVQEWVELRILVSVLVQHVGDEGPTACSEGEDGGKGIGVYA